MILEAAMAAVTLITLAGLATASVAHKREIQADKDPRLVALEVERDACLRVIAAQGYNTFAQTRLATVTEAIANLDIGWR